MNASREDLVVSGGAQRAGRSIALDDAKVPAEIGSALANTDIARTRFQSLFFSATEQLSVGAMEFFGAELLEHRAALIVLQSRTDRGRLVALSQQVGMCDFRRYPEFRTVDVASSEPRLFLGIQPEIVSQTAVLATHGRHHGARDLSAEQFWVVPDLSCFLRVDNEERQPELFRSGDVALIVRSRDVAGSGPVSTVDVRYSEAAYGEALGRLGKFLDNFRAAHFLDYGHLAQKLRQATAGALGVSFRSVDYSTPGINSAPLKIVGGGVKVGSNGQASAVVETSMDSTEANGGGRRFKFKLMRDEMGCVEFGLD